MTMLDIVGGWFLVLMVFGIGLFAVVAGGFNLGRNPAIPVAIAFGAVFLLLGTGGILIMLNPRRYWD